MTVPPGPSDTLMDLTTLDSFSICHTTTRHALRYHGTILHAAAALYACPTYRLVHCTRKLQLHTPHAVNSQYGAPH